MLQHIIATSSDGAVILFGDSGNGVLWLSVNAGSTWVEQTPAGVGMHSWITCACSSDGAILYAAENGKRVYKSTDTGANWTEIAPTGTAEDFLWMTMCCDASGSTVLIGANSDVWYLSSNGGTSWSPRNPYPPAGSGVSADFDITDEGFNAFRYAYTTSGVDLTTLFSAGDWIFIGGGISANTGLFVVQTVNSVSLQINNPSGVEVSDSGITITKHRFYTWSCCACDSTGTTLLIADWANEQVYPTGRLFMSLDSGGSWVEQQPAGNVDCKWNTCALSGDGSTRMAGIYEGRLYLFCPDVEPPGGSFKPIIILM
jgi:hypothetical protein